MAIRMARSGRLWLSPLRGSGLRSSLAKPRQAHQNMEPVVSFCTPPQGALVCGAGGEQNRGMRALAVILVAAAMLFGVYHFYLKKMPVTDEGTAATQAISLTGVRTDLLP